MLLGSICAFVVKWDEFFRFDYLPIRKKAVNRNRVVLEEKDGRRIGLNFHDIATTKVRAYGNRHALDTHHGKPWQDQSDELRKKILKTFGASSEAGR